MKRRTKRGRSGIVIGVPCGKWESPNRFWFSFINIGVSAKDAITPPEMARTDQARNEIVLSLFQRYPDRTHVLFLDDDQIYPPLTIDRLMSHNLPVVGNLYFFRGEPFYPQMYRWNYEKLNERGEPLMDYIEDWEEDSLVKVDCMGAGGLLVAKEVFEQVGGQQGPWFSYGGTGESEEIGFFRTLTRLGIPVYCDTSVESGHLAMVIIGSDNFYFHKWLREQGQEFEHKWKRSKREKGKA